MPELFSLLKNYILAERNQFVSPQRLPAHRPIVAILQKTVSDNNSRSEIKLTNEFISWLKQAEGYEELFEDSDTSGSDPFDSAGYINDDLILIEFKNKIASGMVSYEKSSDSSIEKKIGQVLKQIYKRENGRIYNSVKQFYTENKVPNILIVSNYISHNALHELIEVVERRQLQWYFNVKIIIWGANEPVVLYENNKTSKKDILDQNITFPEFKNTEPKRPNRIQNHEVYDILQAIDKFEEYQLFVNHFKKKGCLITLNRTNISIKLNKTLFSIWPYNSDTEKGLRISFNIDQINKELNPNIVEFSDLQITRVNQKIGFLGFNAYIKTIAEMRKLIVKIDQ